MRAAIEFPADRTHFGLLIVHLVHLPLPHEYTTTAPPPTTNDTNQRPNAVCHAASVAPWLLAYQSATAAPSSRMVSPAAALPWSTGIGPILHAVVLVRLCVTFMG